MRSRTDVDVAVVGAGPVGLFLSGILAHQGISVLVLEARKRASPRIRASTINTRSMELFLQYRVPHEGFTLVPTGHWGGHPVDLMEIDSTVAGLWKMPQPQLCRVLTEWCTSLGVRIVYGASVADVAQNPGSVTLSGAGPTVTARYAVGCDGVDSTVRAAAGVAHGVRRPRNFFLRGDISGADVQPRRFERHGPLTVTAGRLDTRTYRLMVHDARAKSPLQEDKGLLSRLWQEATGKRLPVQLDWVEAFDDTQLRATRFVSGRVCLAGDAAHSCLPVGGECLNSGLYDAHSLAWRLSSVMAGAPEQLLSEYSDERGAVAAQSSVVIRKQTELMFGTHRTGNKTPVGAAEDVAGLSTHYPNSTPPVGPRMSSAELSSLLGEAGLQAAREAFQQGFAVLVAPECDQDLLQGRRARLVQSIGPSRALLRADGHLVWRGSNPALMQRALDVSCPTRRETP